VGEVDAHGQVTGEEAYMTKTIQRSSAHQAFGVTLVAFVVLLLVMPRDLNIFDEGIVLVDAMRIMNGDVVHRDFYSSYGPAQYYLIATLFKIFGINFMVGRLYALTILSTIVGMLFYILHRRVRISFTLIAAAVCGMWMMSFNQYLYPIYPSILLSLAGSYLILSAAEAVNKWGRLAAAGVCTGLITLFRYDSGFFVMIAHLIALAILISIQSPSARRISEVGSAWVAYCIGIGLIFLPAAMAFLAVAPLNDFVADIIDYSRKYYAEMRGLPFPRLKTILYDPDKSAVYLPLLATLLVAGELIRRVFARSDRTTNADRKIVTPDAKLDRSYLIVFGLLAFMLFFKGVVRVSVLHMLMGIIPALIVLAVLASCWWRLHGIARTGTALMGLIVIVPAADAALGELNRARIDSARSVGGWLLGRAGLYSLQSDEKDCPAVPALTMARIPNDYIRVARYLIAHSQSNDRIFVGLTAHDKIFANALSLYFAAGRLPGTHWHQLDPGLQTRANIQEKMVSDLRRNAVNWVVRDANFTGIIEPNGSALSSGVKILDDYLDRNYRLVASSGKVSIWLAKDQLPPPTFGETVQCIAAPAASFPVSDNPNNGTASGTVKETR
jgi:hypothetical protein